MEIVCNLGHMIFFVLKYEIMKMKVKRRLEKIQTAYIDARACLLCKVFERCFNYEEYLFS